MTEEVVQYPSGGVDMGMVLIQQAISQQVPVETMEKLVSIRRELKAEWAREQFIRALAQFQTECPIIKKTKKVSFQKGGGYKFAPLEEIVKQVKPLLSKHGFTYTITTNQLEGQMTVYITVWHIDGHSETSEFTVQLDKNAIMSEPQKAASAATFAKRQAFCNALGIIIGDEDNDATDPQRQALIDSIRSLLTEEEVIRFDARVAELTNNQLRGILNKRKESQQHG